MKTSNIKEYEIIPYPSEKQNHGQILWFSSDFLIYTLFVLLLKLMGDLPSTATEAGLQKLSSLGLFCSSCIQLQKTPKIALNTCPRSAVVVA